MLENKILFQTGFTKMECFDGKEEVSESDLPREQIIL